MCGIAGILYTAEIERDSALNAVDLMCNRMYTRGPDAEGTFLDDGVVLGHRRLSILDLNPRSNQPLTSSKENYTIIFNGEIYNFRELRAELQRKGIQFITDSDTEVLLELYKFYGESFLYKLQGMFAFVIWNQKKKNLFLARDAYGIKPLYYSIDSKRFIFASQVKALQASGLVSNTTELAGLAGFYLWGSVPEPWTCIEGVFAIGVQTNDQEFLGSLGPACHRWTWRSQGWRTRPSFS
jgi:asparagine synthase (glutamine-hydrolysing)